MMLKEKIRDQVNQPKDQMIMFGVANGLKTLIRKKAHAVDLNGYTALLNELVILGLSLSDHELQKLFENGFTPEVRKHLNGR